MLEFEDALKRIVEPINTLEAEEVDLREAVGRVLAQEIEADSDVPFSDNSAMDGYAVIAADIEGAAEDSPVRLEVIEIIPAGSVPEKTVTAGKAARIFTGAPMPAGADSVVMQEFTEAQDGAVLVKAPLAKGKNMRLAGEDIKKGEVVFRAGRKLKAADTGVIASAGYTKVKVGRRPVVGIICTGDELVEPDEPVTMGKVRNSNSYALHAKCLENGAQPLFVGNVRDEREPLVKAFKEASEKCDLIVTSGGVSVGDFDLVTDVLKEIGEIDFWKIRMKPGKPLAYGNIGGTPFLGLPGNPVSVMVGFELFVRPMLMKMQGAANLYRPRATAVMEHEHKEKSSRTKVLRGIATYSVDGITVKTTGMQGSGILMSVVMANCFIIVPHGIPGVAPGDRVEIIRLDAE